MTLKQSSSIACHHCVTPLILRQEGRPNLALHRTATAVALAAHGVRHSEGEREFGPHRERGGADRRATAESRGRLCSLTRVFADGDAYEVEITDYH